MGTELWHVITVHVRNSDYAAEAIAERGYPVYSPRCIERRGSRTTHVPMFPGYMFVQVEDVWWPVLSVPGVRERLRFGDRSATVTDQQIADIRMFETDSLELKVGQQVRVIDGPFAGVECPITTLDGKGRCEILLRILGRHTKAWVSVGRVERTQLLARSA